MSAGEIHELLHQDHQQLAKLLEAASRGPQIDSTAFHRFRAGLLRHIGMEEKVLLPAVRRLAGEQALPLARQMKLDHSALAALLVPTPSPAIVERLKSLLEAHNAMEEGENGVYAQCEQLAALHLDELYEQLCSYPPVKLAPYSDGPRVHAAIERLLRATGRV